MESPNLSLKASSVSILPGFALHHLSVLLELQSRAFQLVLAQIDVQLEENNVNWNVLCRLLGLGMSHDAPLE